MMMIFKYFLIYLFFTVLVLISFPLGKTICIVIQTYQLEIKTIILNVNWCILRMKNSYIILHNFTCDHLKQDR